MCMMHLSRKQYPTISLSNLLVIRRGHCAVDPLCSSFRISPGILSCTQGNPFATPCATLSAHENRPRTVRVKTMREIVEIGGVSDGD